MVGSVMRARAIDIIACIPKYSIIKFIREDSRFILFDQMSEFSSPTLFSTAIMKGISLDKLTGYYPLVDTLGMPVPGNKSCL
jgi:hypothetical protein